MYKLLAILIILLFSSPCYAQWYETEGSAQIRHGDVAEARSRAVDEAIRQAMLDSGSFVTSEQGMNNGTLSTDNFNMSASLNMRQYNLLSEKRENGFITVRVQVFVDTTNQNCLGSNYPVNLLPVLFKYDDGQYQQSINGLEGFNIELTSKLNSLLKNKEKIINRAFFNKNIGIDPLKRNLNEVNLRKTIQQLAIDSDSQYVVAGVLRDLSKHKQDDSWLNENFGDDFREFAISIYVFDGYTGEIIFSKDYSTNAVWKFSGEVNIHSEFFWSSAYGLAVNSILNKISSDIEFAVLCSKPIGRIVRVMPNGEVFINLGKLNGIRQGTRFYIEHNSSFMDHNNRMRFSKSGITTHMVAKEVNSNTSILQAVGSMGGNIQINDYAFIE